MVFFTQTRSRCISYLQKATNNHVPFFGRCFKERPNDQRASTTPNLNCFRRRLLQEAEQPNPPSREVRAPQSVSLFMVTWYPPLTQTRWILGDSREEGWILSQAGNLMKLLARLSAGLRHLMLRLQESIWSIYSQQAPSGGFYVGHPKSVK